MSDYKRFVSITEDYRDGYKAGHADKMNGHHSDICWYAFEKDSQTWKDYSQGYRDGWNEGRAYVN